jgi:hypothetical protein
LLVRHSKSGRVTSLLGQNRTSERFHAMSALLPKADIRLKFVAGAKIKETW